MIHFDDNQARLDVGRIAGWLATSYWTPDIARAQVERQIAGSHCLGAYRDGEQIGFARAITDHASFAWIADVWVVQDARGAGLGRALVRWFLDHADYATVRRFALVTADAHGVYAGLGFHALMRPERYMERLSDAFADHLRTLP